MSDLTGQIHFLSAGDAEDLSKALTYEGYVVSLRPDPAPERSGGWLLSVEPFDDGVVALVDVYGGWLPDEA